jgi:hypothetical protein
MSLRPTVRSVAIPVAVGAVLAIAALLVANGLVRDDVERKASAGFFSMREHYFVGMCAALAFALGYLLTRRLMRGPRLGRRSWMLSMGQVVPATTSYREAAPPSVQDLIDRLEAVGYQLSVRRVDEAGTVIGTSDGRDPLTGRAVILRDERLGPAETGVIVRVSERAAGEGGGLGEVTAVDRFGEEGCEELAMFTICQLAELLPGLKYKPTDSSLEPDVVDMLRASLPDRPRTI